MGAGVMIWRKPYTIESRGWGWSRLHYIVYEETRILVYSDHEVASQVSAALNGAFNLGWLGAEAEAKYCDQSKVSA